jgi:catechol 2,3-dioxygenase-like lactoylglutathione lyase family enzyme
MRIAGILETALYCQDVAKAAAFYRRLFGFPVLLESERLVALNVAEKNVLLLFAVGQTGEPLTVEGGTIPPHGSLGQTHFAFAVDESDFAAWTARLTQEGVPVESVVQWSGGARSLYFRDPDGNMVELMTPGFWAFAPG